MSLAAEHFPCGELRGGSTPVAVQLAVHSPGLRETRDARPDAPHTRPKTWNPNAHLDRMLLGGSLLGPLLGEQRVFRVVASAALFTEPRRCAIDANRTLPEGGRLVHEPSARTEATT